MPIQFPPVLPGDPEPQDGDTYLYLINQQEYVCRRRNLSEAAQWAAKGLITETSFGYRGTLNIQEPAPTDVNTGNIYTVIDGGIASSSLLDLGTEVEQYTLIIFNPEWVPINTGSNSVVTSPWIRTIQVKFNLRFLQITLTCNKEISKSTNFLNYDTFKY